MQRGTSAGKPSALLAEFYEAGGEENLGLQHREGGRGGEGGLQFEFLLPSLTQRRRRMSQREDREEERRGGKRAAERGCKNKRTTFQRPTE